MILGLRVVALILVLAIAGAVVRGLVKARGYGPTLREVVVTLLGVACVLVFLWFVVMYG
jgi:hypothetical protein